MSYTPLIEYYKKRNFGDKLNAAFGFIRENGWPYLKMQLLISGPIMLGVSIYTNSKSIDLLSLDSLGRGELPGEFWTIYGVMLLGALVSFTMVPTVTYQYMLVYQRKAPADISVADVMKGFGSKLGSILGYNLLVLLLLVVVIFLVSIVTGILAIGGIALAIIGMILVFVIMTYFSVVFSLGLPAVGFGRYSVGSALSSSFSLIKSKWWSTFGILVVTTIITYMISTLFSMPSFIFLGAKSFFSIESTGDLTGLTEMSIGERILYIFLSLFQTFGSILSYSIILIAIAFQYFNLVERKEGVGLMDRIANLDQEQEQEEEDNEDY